MSTLKNFYLGARPKTLYAAVSPVLVGGALSANWIFNSFECVGGPYVDCRTRAEYFCSNFNPLVLAACFVVSIALQIGVNYANDYSDGIKGTDKDRVGPMRLVGSGSASPKSVLTAMLISFAVAGFAGIYVASQSSWWLVLVGVACIALAWFYTGSKYPYGYYGFGELVVFITFGLVATVGTFYALSGEIIYESIIIGCIPGAYSVAILLANNIRDVGSDRIAGKKTLAARIGEKRAKPLFASSIMLVIFCILGLIASINYIWIALAPSAIGIFLVRKMHQAKSPKEYISILVWTSKLNIVVSVVIAVAIFANAWSLNYG